MTARLVLVAHTVAVCRTALHCAGAKAVTRRVVCAALHWQFLPVPGLSLHCRFSPIDKRQKIIKSVTSKRRKSGNFCFILLLFFFLFLPFLVCPKKNLWPFLTLRIEQ